jgi:hemerythrin-like metal-binding protein
MEWNEDYSVGVEKFDQQHKRIIDFINKIHGAFETGEERQILMTIFNNLAGYTKTHFAEEERLMTKYEYPLLEKHKGEHQRLNLELAELYRRFFTSNTPLTAELFDLLNRWLFVHILSEDKQYSLFFAGKNME